MSQIDLHDDIGIAADGKQFLTFALGADDFGIDILSVQEIKGYSAITPIPSAPHYIKGVMNLRGTVVPVIDLRAKFSMAQVEYDKFTVIVIVGVRDKTVGVVVDAVSDVLSIPETDLVPPPELGASVSTAFMTGMAKVGEKLILLLDIDQVVSADLLSAIAAAA